MTVRSSLIDHLESLRNTSGRVHRVSLTLSFATALGGAAGSDPPGKGGGGGGPPNPGGGGGGGGGGGAGMLLLSRSCLQVVCPVSERCAEGADVVVQ